MDFGDSTFLVWVCYSGPSIEGLFKLLVLSGTDREKALQQIQASLPTAFVFGLHDPEAPVILEVWW